MNYCFDSNYSVTKGKNMKHYIKILPAILFLNLTFITPTLYAKMKAKASSLQNSSFSPYFAIDGNPYTRWSSGFNDDQWLIIDLEKQKNISSIHIAWENAMAKEYQVLVSNDEKNWKTVFNKTSKMKNEHNQIIIISPPVKARFIKIDCKNGIAPDI